MHHFNTIIYVDEDHADIPSEIFDIWNIHVCGIRAARNNKCCINSLRHTTNKTKHNRIKPRIEWNVNYLIFAMTISLS